MVSRFILSPEPDADNATVSFELGPIYSEELAGDVGEEDDVISAIEAFTPLSVQTSAQDAEGTDTDKKLLYNSASENQGNFRMFYLQAQRDLPTYLNKLGFTLAAADQPRAMAYLIWHYMIMKFPEWNAQSYSPGGTESVTRFATGKTSALAAFETFVAQCATSSTASTTLPTIGKVDDFTNYDQRLAPSPLGPYSIEGDE